MNRNLIVSAVLLVAGSLLADSASKDAVTTAAKKLADQSNYSWKTTMENAGGSGGDGGGGGGRGGFRAGPTEGKTEKGGYTVLSMTRGDNTTRAVLKGDKGAIRTSEGWESLSEAAEAQGGGGGGGGGRGGRFMARMLQNYKTPAVEAEDLISKVKDVTESDGVYSGDLTAEGAKSLLRFGGGRGGGGGPEISGAKGSVKFWVKDGILTKFQTKVQGTVSFNGNDREVNRTTTVEIQDVGNTKIDVPSEATKKIS